MTQPTDIKKQRRTRLWTGLALIVVFLGFLALDNPVTRSLFWLNVIVIFVLIYDVTRTAIQMLRSKGKPE
ncbi:MAG: hypothetical protein AAF386_01165 [Pseudomonadota bacterium]